MSYPKLNCFDPASSRITNTIQIQIVYTNLRVTEHARKNSCGNYDNKLDVVIGLRVSAE